MEKKKLEKLLDLSEQNDGYVSVKEAREKGISQTYLSQAEELGVFRKIAKGLYLKKGYPFDPYYVLHFRYRKAVFCLRSALFLHGLGPSPEVMEVALPRNYMTSGIQGASCITKNGASYLLGWSLGVSPHGPLVPVYDLEMTLIDLILHRDNWGDEEYAKVLDHLPKEKIDKEKLARYAKTLGKEELVFAVLKGRI
ncbi:MAG: type IV toxin-antitoxin system AbiEi family antitoxin domain-containing protein [Candidatus Enteromonas sp.]|nr:type IV toxin-antitoxin system AbiEi family antitoxin domain-containing protein [Candidatus Enteromonas sp.]MDY6093702.1 type IV toxin-antitoxin system AbiEi family antitoxin domain-containing protein [Candidatus Enteromonas sp.]